MYVQRKDVWVLPRGGVRGRGGREEGGIEWGNKQHQNLVRDWKGQRKRWG